MNLLELAATVFEIESKAISQLKSRLDEHFEWAVHCLHNCQGRIVVCGMGKSGLVGKKIAATFSSIGQPALFLHPSEAIHGDLGMLMPGDCFLSISNSGETDELLQLIPYIERLGLLHICLVGNTQSTLAKHAKHILDISVVEEASSLQAVPMASTIATMAMGDALAAALIHLHNFQSEDFARLHPGGSLGRKLITSVGELMRRDALPTVASDCPLRELLMTMSKGMMGLAVVLDNKGTVLGVVTDGDLRRALEKSEPNAFFNLQAKDIMTLHPKSVTADTTLLAAEELMNQLKITALLVLEDGVLVGVIGKQMIR